MFSKPGQASKPLKTLPTPALREAEDETLLPVLRHRRKILHAVQFNQVVVLSAQTGSGKSTQLPLILAGVKGKIAITQPRRLACTSLAGHVSALLGSGVGQECGYSIRYDACFSEATRVKYLTEGMLFNELLSDPLLSRYSVVVLDEVHERTLHTDLIMAAIKKILPFRKELRVILASATVPESVLGYFDNLKVVTIPGRSFPVEISYLQEPVADYRLKIVEIIDHIDKVEREGDILVFLPGLADIEQTWQLLLDSEIRLNIVPLHSKLTAEEQSSIFSEFGRRKVILSTNIAETSVTIPGIRFVIDSGFVKTKIFNSGTNIETLATVPCSLSSLAQRAGRAGRTSPGKVIRLFPESQMASLEKTTAEEISRVDLSKFVLELKMLHVDVLRFDYPTPPPSISISNALEFLFALGAIDMKSNLTPVGSKMGTIPVDPMMAKILVDSEMYTCGEEICTIAAMTQITDVFHIPQGAAGASAELERRKFTAEEGDHLTLLSVYNAFVGKGHSSKWCSSHRINFKAMSQAVTIRKQIVNQIRRFGGTLKSCEGDGKRLRKCLLGGYFRNVASMMPDGTYRSVRNSQVLHVHPSSVMFTRQPSTGWVMYHEAIETDKIYIRDLTVIDPDWLLELAPHYYKAKVKNLA